MATISTDPARLKTAIQEAEKWMGQRLKALKPMKQRLSGQWYSDHARPEAPMDIGIANHEFEVLSLMLPMLVFENPRVKVSTSMKLAEDEAEAIMFGLNRWIRDCDLRKELKLLATDFLLMWCVALISRQPVPGMQEVRAVGGKYRRGVPNRPLLTRIDPLTFIMDPLAKRFEDVAYAGHKLRESRETLLAWAEADNDGTWNVEGIMQLGEDSGSDTMHDPVHGSQDYGERDDIVYWEVWIPSDQMQGFPIEENFHGSIHTIAWDDSPDVANPKPYMLRAPRPWFGPPTGPYRLGGAYIVPSEALPLSGPVAIKGMVDALNRQKSASLRASEAYKRLLLLDEINANVAQQIRDNPDLTVLAVASFRKEMAEVFEVGGTTETEQAQISILQQDVDRVSGLSDASRGVVTGQGTATEVAVADQSNDMRSSWIIEQFTSFTEDCLLDAAFLMHHDDTVAFPLGLEVAQQMGLEPSLILTPSGPALMPPDPWFHGGMSSLPFNRLELSIEAFSMQRTSPNLQQAQLMTATNLVTAIAPTMPMLPFIKWDDFVKLLQDVGNMPELHKLIDFEMLALMTQNSLMLQQTQMGDPRLAGDMGAEGGQQQGQISSAQGPQAQPLQIGSGGGSQGSAGQSKRPMGNGQRADQPRKQQGTSGRSQGQFAKSKRGG